MSKKSRNRIEPKSVGNALLQKVNEERDGELHAKSRVIDSLAGSLGEALEEDYKDYSDIEASEERNPLVKSKTPLKTKLTYVFGAFVSIMTVIGIISTITFGVDLAASIADQKALKTEFAVFLYPVVTSDMPTFSDANDLPSNAVICASIWQIILSGKTDNYEKLYNYYMIVPAIDVENTANKLFGYGFTIEHQTVSNLEMSFDYNAETNSYTVPISPSSVAYSPRIAELSRIGELYTLTVDYMAPSPMAIAGFEYENEPVKTMVYTISKNASSMTINSIANVERDADDGYVY